MSPVCQTIFPKENVWSASQLPRFSNNILAGIDQFVQNGSGWVLRNIRYIQINTARYRPVRGSSFIPLPRALAFKRAIINIKNEDLECFRWALLSAIFPVTNHPERVTHYVKYTDALDFSGIPFPVDLHDVPLIEERNNLSINVWGYTDDEGLSLLKCTNQRDDPDAVIHILMLRKGDNVHYCWIKRIDFLLYGQNSHGGKKHFCPFCASSFNAVETKNKHQQYCQWGQRTEMPDAGDQLKFTNVKNRLVTPLVIYADFECLLSPLDEVTENKTRRTHQHIPHSFAAVTISQCGCERDSVHTKDRTLYRGEDPVGEFLRHCLKMGGKLQEMIDNVRPIDNSIDWSKQRGNICHICTQPIDVPGVDFTKVKDHCHFCGRYRGPAHRQCNLAFRTQRDLPIVFHNLRRYDGNSYYFMKL